MKNILKFLFLVGLVLFCFGCVSTPTEKKDVVTQIDAAQPQLVPNIFNKSESPNISRNIEIQESPAIVPNQINSTPEPVENNTSSFNQTEFNTTREGGVYHNDSGIYEAPNPAAGDAYPVGDRRMPGPGAR